MKSSSPSVVLGYITNKNIRNIQSVNTLTTTMGSGCRLITQEFQPVCKGHLEALQDSCKKDCG